MKLMKLAALEMKRTTRFILKQLRSERQTVILFKAVPHGQPIHPPFIGIICIPSIRSASVDDIYQSLKSAKVLFFKNRSEDNLGPHRSSTFSNINAKRYKRRSHLWSVYGPLSPSVKLSHFWFILVHRFKDVRASLHYCMDCFSEWLARITVI